MLCSTIFITASNYITALTIKLNTNMITKNNTIIKIKFLKKKKKQKIYPPFETTDKKLAHN